MSEINRELQDQQDKDIGAAMRKVFGDIPVIDAKQIEEQELKELEKSEQRLKD